MSRHVRDSKIHWYGWSCRGFDHHMRDLYTNMPGLITCGICKRHVKWLRRNGDAVKFSQYVEDKMAGVLDDDDTAGMTESA